MVINGSVHMNTCISYFYCDFNGEVIFEGVADTPCESTTRSASCENALGDKIEIGN